MLDFIKMDRWSPFISGALLALLSLCSFYFFGEMLGTSRTFVRIAAAFWNVVDPQHLQENPYYRGYLENNVWINWQFALVVGVFIGSYLAGNLFHKSPVVHVPAIWKNSFGDSRWKRYLGAFLGGVTILIGARFAGGCTSGHGISGGMQLATTGWLFMMGLFGAGIPTAFLMYKTKKGGE